ncbi:MAG: hypothetical protein HC837_13345 [Chloroflexaceae bacterium]|nr:hypothetical protein [Chloroflexaceae bacterium]
MEGAEVNPYLFGLQLTFMGIGVVFVGLTLIALLLMLMQYIYDRVNTPTVTDVPDSAAIGSQSAPSVLAEGISPEVMGVISAAVAVAVGKQVRVQRIRYQQQPRESTWSRQGRISVMVSHQIRPPMSTRNYGDDVITSTQPPPQQE